MRPMRILYLLCLTLVIGCNESKWEKIKGTGIDKESKSLDPIYFDDPDNGVVGGYTLVNGNGPASSRGLEPIPLLYITENGGQIWNQIHLGPKPRGRITNVYLNADTLICTKEDSTVLFSTNRGKTIDYIKNDIEYKKVKRKYFGFNRYKIDDPDFDFENVQYPVKEIYKNELSTVIVCRGPEVLTDYYFVSFDNGKNWKYLQKDYGSVRQKYLYEDKYLFSYNYPFGLDRLKLQ